MYLRPLTIIDAIRINVAIIFNKLYHKTKFPLFRILGDYIVRFSKVMIDDVIYVLVDLISLSFVDPRYGWKVTRILRILSPGSYFIDVGAHIGKYSLSLAKKGVNVIAIEPNPIVFKALIMGIKLNRLTTIRALNLALSDYDGTTKLYIRRRSDAATIKEPNYFINIKNITVKKLDSLIQKMNFKKIDLIKINVSDAEVEIIKGSIQTLAKFNPFLIIGCHDKNYKKLIVMLQSLDYNYQVLERYETDEYSILFCTPHAVKRGVKD